MSQEKSQLLETIRLQTYMGMFFVSSFLLYALAATALYAATLPDFVSAYEKNIQAVVTVKVTKKSSSPSLNSSREESELKAFFRENFAEPLSLLTKSATGSGVFIDKIGLILTAGHLVKYEKIFSTGLQRPTIEGKAAGN